MESFFGTGDVSENPWGGSKGTKVFALAGKVENTGLIEVPMGITLREIIYDVGGGIPKKKQFKAVQTGGPLGGCLPAEALGGHYLEDVTSGDVFFGGFNRFAVLVKADVGLQFTGRDI